MSKICLCLRSETKNGILEQIRHFENLVDFLEVRLDFLSQKELKNIADLPNETSLPIILTARREQDGGNWPAADEQERQKLLIKLLENSKWHYVDIESDAASIVSAGVMHAAQASDTRIIRSLHDFSGGLLKRSVPEIAALIRELAQDDCIPKLAAHCSGSRDLLTLARLSLAVEDINEKVILGMGEYGIPSRILADRMGSSWCYATPGMSGTLEDRKRPVAPGQTDVKTLSELYRFSSIDKSTKLYAVVGNPIAHSQSPAIHNRWLREAGINGCYISFRSDKLAATLETCDIWSFSGLSITVPFKEEAIRCCEYIGPVASRIQAVNTLLRRGDGWSGRNTDGFGFLNSLLSAMNSTGKELKSKKVLILGAGGAARSAVYMLHQHGAEITIVNRSPGRARELAESANANWHKALQDAVPGAMQNLVQDVGSMPATAAESAPHTDTEHNSQSPAFVKWGPMTEEFMADLGALDIVVQTTAVGMNPEEDPVPWWNPAGCHTAYDMIYNPPETRFLTRCRQAGLQTFNGETMLTEQARLQYDMFV